VLPLRAELWSGSPTKTRLPKPADVSRLASQLL
jgi:hypothetical protein